MALDTAPQEPPPTQPSPWWRPAAPKNAFARALARGFRGRCPQCGTGWIFYRYLKVSPRCAICDHNLDAYPSDDGPAYFTILIVGQLVVAPLLLFRFIWKLPIWVVVPITLIPLAVLTLVLLPRIKGAVIGLHYALRITRADAHLHTADRFR